MGGYRPMPIRIGDTLVFVVEEVSELFSLTPVTVRKHLHQGRLKGKKLGRRWYITADSLQAYFQERSPGGE